MKTLACLGLVAPGRGGGGSRFVGDSLAITCPVKGLCRGQGVGLTRVGGLGICALWVAGHGYRKGPLSPLDLLPESPSGRFRQHLIC